MIIGEMLVKIRQRARSLDAFSHLYRDFQYRLISTYTFSESSRHSEHNDMRQGYVLINRLGCRAKKCSMTSPPCYDKKFMQNCTAYYPVYSCSEIADKLWYTFIEHMTPG